MRQLVLRVHPNDNLIVALQDLKQGQELFFENEKYRLVEDIPARHKFAARDFVEGEPIIMYGVQVGKALMPVAKGTRMTTQNLAHAAEAYKIKERSFHWTPPDISEFKDMTFNGFHRPDGSVGTRNYWMVIPLVFCENRNIEVIREAMLEKLGYSRQENQKPDISALIEKFHAGVGEAELWLTPLYKRSDSRHTNRVFKNVDGIRFLTHQGGCGGTRQDSEMLCNLLAGYINNPNVAGATVLSLGCQNAQIRVLQGALDRLQATHPKPVYFLEQQQSFSEQAFIEEAIKATFLGLMQADKIYRQPAPLDKLTIGLECGGSDGFSGITANPALGVVSDLVVALGGRAILAEFPELNGVEQELVNRCVSYEQAERFVQLMHTYATRAEQAGSGFHMNPSPGNIREGLITDAMKSAGAAKKGGTSPVTGVLDYAEQPREAGLQLLCTPGNDVESTTGLAGSGANMILFTTGLGTPTGNPVAPTIKVSSNSDLAERMSDIIDVDAGTIASGEDTIQTKGVALLHFIIQVANGEILTKAELLGQEDFIPWKRGISL